MMITKDGELVGTKVSTTSINEELGQI